jgi:hypothetical protein
VAEAELPRGAATRPDDAKDRVGGGRRVDVRRDRDSAGRARNSRPRDALGRPLPYGSPDVPRAPEGVLRTPEETITQAQQMLDDGLPFHAHEIFEDAWKTAGSAAAAAGGTGSVGGAASADADRALWKGLAQIAVGLTHLARGNNNRGAQTLLRRGAAAIAPYRLESPYGLDVSGIIAWATELTDRLGSTVGPDENIGSWTAPRLRIRAPGAGAAPPSG